jgi:hypothetical protein
MCMPIFSQLSENKMLINIKKFKIQAVTLLLIGYDRTGIEAL